MTGSMFIISIVRKVYLHISYKKSTSREWYKRKVFNHFTLWPELNYLQFCMFKETEKYSVKFELNF